MCPHARETARARACVARVCACMAARAFACEAASAATLRLRLRKSARFMPRALPVAGCVGDSAFDFESDDA